MYRSMNLLILVALVFSFHLGFAQTKNQPLTGQSFSGEITIPATPDRVWAVLTDAGHLTQIMGYEYVGGTKKFGEVGDEATVKVWGDAGNFVLIRANQSKELRFALDPENGSYICNCRWLLSKSGNGTKVWFGERYTESGPQTEEDLAAQVRDTNEQLARLTRKVVTK